MATVTSTFASYDRSIPPTSSVNSTGSRQNRNLFSTDMHSMRPRIGHCLDGK
jgi:hypothetical protein